MTVGVEDGCSEALGSGLSLTLRVGVVECDALTDQAPLTLPSALPLGVAAGLAETAALSLALAPRLPVALRHCEAVMLCVAPSLRVTLAQLEGVPEGAPLAEAVPPSDAVMLPEPLREGSGEAESLLLASSV